MNVIIAYLETMFSAYPQPPRLLEAKTELQGMMEDAYTNLIAEGRTEDEAIGQVLRDFGNLEEVAPILGIASEITPAPATAPSPTAVVTLDEAQGYADAQHRTRFRVSTAIMLFVLSPAALLTLPTAANSGLLPITDSAGVFIGILFLLVLVAMGVVLLVSTSRELAPYEHIAEGRVSTHPEVAQWAETLVERHDPRRTRALQVAIALWILAPAPLLAFTLFLDDSPLQNFWIMVGVVLVLVIVAAGLWVLLPQAWAHTVAERLGLSGKYTESESDENSIVGFITAFYWPLLAAIYLAWSFIGNAWRISWIVWAIGGLLFGAIVVGSSAIKRYRRASL